MLSLNAARVVLTVDSSVPGATLGAPAADLAAVLGLAAFREVLAVDSFVPDAVLGVLAASLAAMLGLAVFNMVLAFNSFVLGTVAGLVAVLGLPAAVVGLDAALVVLAVDSFVSSAVLVALAADLATMLVRRGCGRGRHQRGGRQEGGLDPGHCVFGRQEEPTCPAHQTKRSILV